MLNEDRISSLPDHPIDALNIVCTEFISDLRGAKAGNSESGFSARLYDDFLKLYALAQAILENTDFKIITPDITDDVQYNMSGIEEYFDKTHNLVRIELGKRVYENSISQFRVMRGSAFYYEFSKNEMDRIQILLNELRDLITKSKEFEDNHKSRLLSRLEILQSELHKKVSDLDRFWGLVGDAGVVLGKFGKDSKPIVDRIREIASIVWNAQSRAEKLPSGSKFPLLKNDEDD